MKNFSINTDQETMAILTLLKEADSFYKRDGFIIHRALFPQPEWVVNWLGIPAPGIKFEPTENNIKELTKKKLNDLEAKGFCTGRYISRLKQRITSDEMMNPGMLLTGHQWGDNLFGLLADTTHFDHLPIFDVEGDNTVFLENEKLSREEIDAWQKHRITFTDVNTASYTLIYTEIGISIKERQYAFFIIRFKKADNTWKVDDMTIKEDSRKNILSLYDKSMEYRKEMH
ncbi:MAG: hypothetical protein JXB88_27370 [Spirochaetales bacterium]|nr:hypothetical protein [Spirochaetales bacterium]